MFTPEFRNRLDATISFAPLTHEVILRVVDKFLMQLEDQLHEKKVEASFTQALKDHLAKHGFDPLMGARPMARLIQDTIRRALADELLFGKLATGGKVTGGRGQGRQGPAGVSGRGGWHPEARWRPESISASRIDQRAGRKACPFFSAIVSPRSFRAAREATAARSARPSTRNIT